MDRFGGSASPAAITSILKQRLYDLESAVHEAVDSVFQQVNVIIRDTLGQALSEIDNSINGLLGSVSQTMGAGRINGYAHIVGDSLKELRLDIYAQFKVATEMEVKGHVLNLSLIHMGRWRRTEGGKRRGEREEGKKRRRRKEREGE